MTGLLVKYGNPNAFADSILKLIDNEKLRKRMSKDAVAWAGYFSWGKSADQLLEVIDREVEAERKAIVPGRFSYILNRLTSLF